jgi:hypothetical protein
MGKLILTRSCQHVAGLRLFQIVIDGQRLASISRGQTTVIELPVGHHEVMARMDWCRTNPLGIEVGLQANHHAEVGSIVGWWYWLLIFTSWIAVIYWHNIIVGLVCIVLCSAPSTLLRHRFLYLRTITASEAAARRGTAVPHPDALPPIRLTRDLFGKG